MIMPHCIDQWRMSLNTTGTAQAIQGYSLLNENIPAFIQPMDSKEAFYYEQRGLEDLHTVYTSNTCIQFQRNDILVWNNATSGANEQYHVVGVKNGLKLNIYQELTVYQYPEGAKRRLDKEAYGS